jgi:transposase-like protein
MDNSNRAVVEAGTAKRSKHRRRSAEEKQRIVEAALLPGASVARATQEHGVSASQVHTMNSVADRQSFHNRESQTHTDRSVQLRRRSCHSPPCCLGWFCTIGSLLTENK